MIDNKFFVIGLLVVAVVVSVGLPANVADAQSQDAGDYCDSYEPIDIGDGPDEWGSEPVNSPDDTDAFILSSSKGDYFVFGIRVPTDASQFALTGWGSVSFSQSTNWAPADGYSYVENSDEIATFKVHDENRDGELCLRFGEEGYYNGEYDFEFRVAKNHEPQWYENARATPTPTPTPTSTPSPTRTASPTPTPTPTATDSPGASTPSPTDSNGDSGTDIRDSDGDGVIDSEDYAPDDPDVQEKSDLQDTTDGSAPGLGAGVAVVALVVAASVAVRRS